MPVCRSYVLSMFSSGTHCPSLLQRCAHWVSLCERFGPLTSPGCISDTRPLTAGKSYKHVPQNWPQFTDCLQGGGNKGQFFSFDSDIRNENQELKEIYCAGAAQTHNKANARPFFMVPGTDGAHKDPHSLWRSRGSFSKILTDHLWRNLKGANLNFLSSGGFWEGSINPPPVPSLPRQCSPGFICLI